MTDLLPVSELRGHARGPGRLRRLLLAATARLRGIPSAAEEGLQLALQAVDQGLLLIEPDGTVTLLNRRAALLLDLPESIVGQHLHPWEPKDEATLAALHDLLQPGAGPRESLRPSGQVLEIRGTRLAGGGALRTLTDISARRAAEARIRFLAQHDALTGFAKRPSFTTQLEEMMATQEAQGQGVAVLFLHLDRFKQVKDAKGHEGGDELLLVVARRLRATLRGTDLAARMGGDEFAVMIPVAGNAPEAATALARRLQARISAPYQVSGSRIAIGCSVGVALFPGDADSAEQLLKHAGMAMYRANRTGHGGVRFFESGMDAERSRRRALEDDLHRALDRGELRLVYQPVFDARTGGVTSCEALLRWRHPQHGEVSPGEFIPIAEACGLIVPIGAWVLQQACEEAALWPSEVAVAVNLSPAQFWAADLLATVDDMLGRAHLPASRLALEVTEGLMIDDPGRALHLMHEFRVRGIGLWLDDFGTGHASLSYLRRFPFQKIKIDRSFVAALGTDQHAAAIVEAIIALSRALDMSVVAEGVETQAQADLLRRLRCDQIQGYLTGRPMEREAIRALLQPAPARGAELIAFPDAREGVIRSAPPVARFA